MNFKYNSIIAIIFLLIVVLVSIKFLGNESSSTNLGAVQDGQAYTSTTTSSVQANSIMQVKSTGGVLGSVIITTTHATAITLYNATSSTDIASTTIATFAASAGVGTYVFDSAFDRGLTVRVPSGFAGSYTITYR